MRAVERVSFDVAEGETVALVGESGCGKSVTALSLARLVPEPAGRFVSGQVVYRGQDVLGMDDAALRDLRGNEISYVFQEPSTSLNPVFRVGYQIGEALRLHRPGRDSAAEVHRLLELVGIPDGPAPRPGLPARTQRRHAAARDDRHGPGLPPAAPGGGRTDHRPGRDHPGADPRPARSTCSASWAWRCC